MRWTNLVELISGRDLTNDNETTKAMTETTEPSLQQRHEPCSILTRNGVANVVWFEDVLAHYSSDTFVFGLHVLVSDMVKATKLLTGAGYKSDPKSVMPKTPLLAEAVSE